MTKYIVIAILLSACSSTKKWEQKVAEEPNNYSPYQREVKHYQDSMSYAFISGENKVLSVEDLYKAKPFKFYEPDSNFRRPARFERIIDGKEFEMPTSTDRLPIYRPFGILHFELGGDSLQLHLYQNMEHKDYLFCPFKDKTNGEETYGAGRYLDFSLSDTLNPIIDFNYCYNPYCAYNANYSCPIPPKENHLDVSIEAGVKKWKE